MAEIYQVITKLIDGKSKTLNFTTPSIPIISVKIRIQELTSIPIHQQLLLSNGKHLRDDGGGVLTPFNGQFPTVHLLLRLRGGKGGFGSLLRGAATKAGQKKTNNFDACRDMSGRRLRHVNAEKKMEEWIAEEKERKLEKMAEDFIKKREKMAKKSGGSGGDGGAEKYVEKYRMDSAKCMEEVDKSVRESLGSVFKSKRRVVVGEINGSQSSKKMKIWMGKRKTNESDSDSDGMDEDGSDEEMAEQNEMSVVTNNENYVDSNKEAEGSSGSVNGGKFDGESSVGCPSESGSEEEEPIPNRMLTSSGAPNAGSPCGAGDDPSEPVLKIHEERAVLNELSGSEAVQAEMDKSNKTEFGNIEETVSELPSISSVNEAGSSGVEGIENSDCKPLVDEETVTENSNGLTSEKPLNFDDFSSATEMEDLGMERLKSELQERGLKCGGTLQERAARLFLLKTTPLEKLPKKLLAKK